MDCAPPRVRSCLRGSHGEKVRGGSGNTTKAVLSSARNSEFFGHIHRSESAHETVHPRQGPIVYGAYSPGTIARIDNGVVPSNVSRQNWQQGLGTIDYFEGNDLFSFNNYIISNGKAIVRGKYYESRPIAEIEEEMTNLTGWDFRR